jgi:hypothetical protein
MAGRVASEASRVGGSFFTLGAQKKRPPPLTPPHHSLREWGEGNPAACACSKYLLVAIHSNYPNSAATARNQATTGSGSHTPAASTTLMCRNSGT